MMEDDRPAELTPCLRGYEARDREVVWALHEEGLRDTGALYHRDPKWDDDLRDVEGVYLRPGSGLWVVEEPSPDAGQGGRLVGMVAVQRVDADTARLRRMRVSADRRRQGIAQRLLETAVRFCRDQGYARIVLDTTEQQTAAHRLYESAGFVRTGERTIGAFRVFDYQKELL